MKRLARAWSLLPAIAAVAFDGGALADGGRTATGPLAATGSIEAAFTPGDRIDNLIIAAIDGATHEVLVNAYTFTHRRIAAALIDAKKRGVDVQVIADAQEAAALPQNVLPQLVKGGVAVWLDANFQAAHNKVVIVDAGTPGATTITGSYNFTIAAQWHNAENVLILRDNPALARAYRDNWLKLKRRAKAWTPQAPN